MLFKVPEKKQKQKYIQSCGFYCINYIELLIVTSPLQIMFVPSATLNSSPYKFVPVICTHFFIFGNGKQHLFLNIKKKMVFTITFYTAPFYF